MEGACKKARGKRARDRSDDDREQERDREKLLPGPNRVREKRNELRLLERDGD